MLDKTMVFSISDGDKEAEMKRILTTVFDSLRKKGYNPIYQIVGYLISDDPTYITNYNNARNLIRRYDRYEMLAVITESYLNS